MNYIVLTNWVMAYIRKKKVKGYTYYYIVEGRIEKGKVKQRVVYYIGTIETLLKKLRAADEVLKKNS